MSFLPKILYTTSPEKVENVKFYGIDRNEGASEGSFIDSRNMVSRDYPFLSSRDARFYSKLPEGMKLLGIYSAKELCFVLNDGAKSYFYFGGKVKGEWEDTEQKEKFFCEVGGAIYIFPDRKLYRMKNERAIEEYKTSHTRYGETGTGYISFRYNLVPKEVKNTNLFRTKFNTHAFDVGDAIKIWAFDKASGEKVSLLGLPFNKGITLSGSGTLKDYYVSASAIAVGLLYECDDSEYIKFGYEFTYPEEYDEAFTSFASSIKANEIHKDSDGYQYLVFKQNVSIGTNSFATNLFRAYLEFSYSEGITVYFSVANDILASIVPESAVIEEVGVEKFNYSNNGEFFAYLKFAPDTFNVPSTDWIDDKYAVLYADEEKSKKAYIDVTAKYPRLSGAVNVNNRLWGYEGNTIYASALGKPYIMGAYKGISTDSWAVETGTKRNFTAVYSYNSIPHFFTEDGIIKVYGSAPSSFSTSETVCAGVKGGSSASLAVCGGVLYYLDKDGNIASYTGSYPSVISRRLNEAFVNASISADDRYLYCICKKAGSRKVLYIFDTLYGIWLIDGELEANHIINHGGCVYICVDGYIITDKEISLSGFERYTEAGFESCLEFPVTDEGLFNMKKLKKVLFKINASEGTSLRVEVRETDSPEYRRIFERVIEGGDEVLTIPADCRRTLGYSVRISGRGKWKLCGIMRRVSIGSYKGN